MITSADSLSSYWNVSISNSLVDRQSNGDSSFLVRVQDSGLWSYNLKKKKKQYMKHMGILVVLLFIYYLCNLHWNIQWVDCFSRELTILCFPASLIQWMLSLYCCFTRSGTLALISSRTVAAMLSVTARSLGSPDVHTQRNGPKPNEKISLGKGIWNEIKNIAHKLIHTSH